MAQFTKDTSKVRAFSAGPIKETNMYPCTIIKAYDRASQTQGSEAKSIHLDIVADTGQYGSIDLWYQSAKGLSVDKNGRDLPALSSINDLMVLLELDSLDAKPGMVKIYDFDIRQDVDTKKRIYPDLIGQSIGAVFQMVETLKQVNQGGVWGDDPAGAKVCRPEFLQFCSPDGHSASEFMNGQDPVAIERYLAGLDAVRNRSEDAHIIKQANNAENAPVKDAITFSDDDFDSVPF
ncbi:MAG: hypothetical protein WC756_21590 [Taibaiella sp.]|jgi:hypothetical protein